MTTTYPKKAITIKEQVQLLKTRGLAIDNDAICEQFLTNVSYYRTAWYFSAFQNQDDTFKIGTNFSTIKQAYIIDQRLRNLVAEGIERIEIALRARIVNTTCCGTNDAFWHIRDKATQKIATDRLKKAIRKENSCPLSHYNNKYRDKNNPNHEYPFWIISELFFFTDLSRIYEKGIGAEHKKIISKEFSLNPYKMSNCLHSLAVLRNTVAHHDKIFNRKFSIKPIMPWIGKKENRMKDTNLFINNYYIICHFLSVIHPHNTWKIRVDELLNHNPDIARGYGFTNEEIESCE